MKARTIAWTFVMCLVGLTFAFADNPQMGTWKLNEAKSKMPPGMPKNSTIVYEAAGDQVKITIDGTDAKGAPTHSEWTGKFDGKDYPVTGDATSDMRSYKKINDHTLEFVAKKGDKTTLSGKITVSADGKTRSVTATGTGPDGKKVTGTVVYDKQ
jgi:ribosomal protein L21E